MSRRKIKAGSTSQILPVFIQDTSSTTGAGMGSLVYNTASLAAKYRRQGDSSWTAITLVTATAGTFTSGGFVADGGSVTGGYEIGLPNAMLAAGATWAQLQIYGAANMLAVLVEFELDAVDYQDTVRFGLTALPNVASGSAGGLIVQGTGTTGLDVASGKVLLQATQTGVTIPTVTTVTNQLTASAISTQVMTDLGTGSALTSLAPAATALSTATWTATIAGRIDATISSRLALASYSAPPSAATISSQVQADLGTGSALTALAPAATALSTVVWTPTMAGYLDAAVSSRLASGSYTAPLDATGIRNAVGLASANLDTQLDALPTAAENSTAVWAAVTRSLTDKAGFSLATAPPTADENAAALLDLANAIESGLTVRQAMRLIVAADAGKVSGGGTTTVTIRDIADTKDRIVATVDSDGNRTAITRDLT